MELLKPREMTPEEAAVFGKLWGQVVAHTRRNMLRSDYHNSKKRLERVGFSVPPHMVDFQTPIGWAEKTVTVPAARVRPDGYTSSVKSGLSRELDEITGTDAHRALERQWTRSAMQHGVSFAFVTPNDDPEGEPIRTLRPASKATATVDPRTGEVTAALEMVSTTQTLMYLPGLTLRVERVRGPWMVLDEYVGIKDLVPCSVLPWDASLERPMGRSRITRPLMGFIDNGVRTMLRQEVQAEFFSAPQRSLLGAQPEHFQDDQGNKIDPLKALIGGIWALPDVFDEDEQKLVRPAIQQLQQASMQPHSDMLRTIAAMVSSETTMPLAYLGVVHDNPSSADAILASESDMVAMIENELPSIGAARVDYARKILAVKHGELTPAMSKDLTSLRAGFRDPGTPTLAARADAGQKYVSTFPDGDPEVAMEVYGLRPDQIERNLAHARKVDASSAIDALLAATTQPSGGA
ncbi:phage portal protein [Galactobacter caseinivorans]|uniref:Phage portal protein n=2 Tax=Galactobacter caseinivorans TaxID=2676123 RepID=A0A496PMK9_9MICC|nr:phage portal protein [Galactobacter caseinivorans]